MIIILLTFILFTSSYADSNCSTSTPWTTCECPQMDLPSGVIELVSPFIPTEILNPLLDNVMEELCEGKSISEISYNFGKNLYLMMTDEMKQTINQVDEQLEECLQPDFSLKDMVHSIVKTLEYSLHSYGEVMHNFALTFDESCSSIIDEMYGKLCPVFNADLIQSVLSHIQKKLGKKAFSCLEDDATSLVHFEKYKF